jgi:PncC family amidohydrolase
VARLAERLVARAIERRLWLAVAESCTGGEVAAAISSVPGASQCFWGGIVVYTADAKATLAGLDPDRLAADGAVSRVTTERLAEGIRSRAGADFGLAVTGWAGPDGGGPDPVGCVYLAIDGQGHRTCSRRLLSGPREHVRRQAARELLSLAFAVIGGAEHEDR